MMSSFKCGIRVIVRLALLGFTLGVPLVSGEPAEEKARNSLPLLRGDEEKCPRSWWRTSIRWKDVQYSIDDGIAVLMNVVRDPDAASGHWNAAAAITQFATLGGYLNGQSCLDELAKRYDTFGVSERGAVLLCFKTSGDPRGIPLFVHVLDEEKNVKLRLWAASGLANWNVRRGVAELVTLLDSQEEMPQPSQLFYVCDDAMRTFRLQNIRKGWGFPDDKESAEWPPDVMPPPDVAARLKPRPAVAEIKRWFAENEHRFPDWNPGDPLPEVPAGDNNKPTKE